MINVNNVRLQFGGRVLFEDVNLTVIDSRSACIMEGYFAHYGQVLADKGYESTT